MTDELQSGDTLGPYLLGERLGGGGFGAVWKATDRETGPVVALKVLRTDLYSSDTTKLRGEVELLAGSASSSSRHVVKVLGGGVEPRPYVVMEYVEGIDLGREIERRRRIPQMETIRIGLAVAEALGALQAVGIIHRDVKPSNIMIDSDGDTKLTDFGIAKIVGFDTITATSQMPMTQAYAAPEVWEGKASHQSDLYALGCVLFQCLTGRPPFTGSIAELFRSHTLKDPDWTMLPEGTVPALRDLLRTCLAKAEDDRPASAAEVVHALDAAERELQARLAGSTATDLPVHEPQAFGPWLRREPHPAQPWAFLCINETTGEKATVEIHFADDIEYGSRLRKAVEVNPKLVPLGAERLLGTNRLVLRPGEAWTNAPKGQFQFWVAREELPSRPGPETMDDEMLARASASLMALASVASQNGLELRLPPEDLRLLSDGTVMVRRAGLATTGDDEMAWLRSLRLDGEARTSVANARDLSELVAGYTARVGVARAAEAVARGTLESGFETVVTRRLEAPDLPPNDASSARAPSSTEVPGAGVVTTESPTASRPAAALPSRPVAPRPTIAPRTPLAEAPPKKNHVRLGPVYGNKWWILVAFGGILVYVVALLVEAILAVAGDDGAGTIDDLDERAGLAVVIATATPTSQQTSSAEPASMTSAVPPPATSVETATTPPPQGGPPSRSNAIYEIQDGDTCFSIAERFGISLAALLSLNQWEEADCARMYVGERIYVSEPER